MRLDREIAVPRDDLPPDPDSLTKWKRLPQNKPSKQALPPVAGGAQWTLWLLVILFALVLIVLLVQGRIL